MGKHTAEKWVFNDNTPWNWKNNPYSVTCRKPGIHAATIAAIRNCRSIPDTEKRANALLIAAAPDLLDVVESCIKWYANRNPENDELWPYDNQPPEIQRAMDVIAKTKGE
jgi:hypothetical protein